MIASMTLVGLPIRAKHIEGLGSRQLSLQKPSNRLSELVVDFVSGGVSSRFRRAFERAPQALPYSFAVAIWVVEC